MKKVGLVLAAGLLLAGLAGASRELRAQDAKSSGDAAAKKESEVKKEAEAKKEVEAKSGQEYSGMYSFLKEGEFVQISVEDAGQVSGFVSRFGAGDAGEFVDQYFKSGKLDGNQLSFTTKIVRGTGFDFQGTVERGEGKNPGDEGYFVLKGRLTETASDASQKVTSSTRDVVFKMFPQDAPAAKK